MNIVYSIFINIFIEKIYFSIYTYIITVNNANININILPTR